MKIKEGDVVSFEEAITVTSVDQFAALSGDNAALHMDDAVARNRGFKGRVVHGALLIAFLSKLVGIHLGQKNELLVSMNVKFINPSYIGDIIKVSAIVDQVSESTSSIVLKAKVERVDPRHDLLSAKIIVNYSLKI